jgi:15-cis-phytoene synthase
MRARRSEFPGGTTLGLLSSDLTWQGSPATEHPKRVNTPLNPPLPRGEQKGGQSAARNSSRSAKSATVSNTGRARPAVWAMAHRLLPVPWFRGRSRLAEGYAYCERITRHSASSFASTFWLLDANQRHAIHAIYAFCRLADDIADEPKIKGDREHLLDRWRTVLETAYNGHADHPVGIALADTVERFQLPQEVFRDLLRGVASDLRRHPMNTFDDLRLYCYRVASTVGLLIVSVLGYRNTASLNYAADMGVAVQLTNIIRDVGEDAAVGRVYLAREDLDRMGVTAESLCDRRMTDEIRLLLAFYAERARIYYERAARELPHEDRRTLRPAQAMGQIYRVQLAELQRRGFPCLNAKMRLSKPRRLAIAASVWLGWHGRA